MTPHAYMRQILRSLGVSGSRLARETEIGRTTVARMLAGSTLGTTRQRKALTEWGRKRGLVRADESWWEAVYRASEEDAVQREVARCVRARQDVCPTCGAPLNAQSQAEVTP